MFFFRKSDQVSLNENGIEEVNQWLGMEVPEVYSQGLSEFVMAAGVKLLHEFKPDIMYLSTTDFIQHKYAPGEEVANTFYAMFDKYIGELNTNNNSIIITADHGMQPKSKSDGTPNAIYLQDILDAKLGKNESKVILPITDPYVVHHGALGSFATIYLSDKSMINHAISEIKKFDDIYLLSFPRIFNFGFNPISIYFFSYNNQITHTIYEVKNTFGDIHHYITKNKVPKSRFHKRMFVSPFFKNDGYYEILSRFKNKSVFICIHYL